MRLRATERRLRSPAVALLCLLPLAAAAAETPPNILFILADDLGIDDVGAFGSPDAHTPNIDRLAAQGTRFTRHYVDSSCAATRAGLLAGAAPARHGFRPAGPGISPEVPTYADRLAALGYRTHHVGKWHAGFASRLAWPRQQGFADFYGFLNQFLLRDPGEAPGWRLRRPTYQNPWLQEGNSRPARREGYLTDLLTDAVVERIEAADDGRPWLINAWYFAPHTPQQPPPALRDRFPDTPRGRHLAMVASLDRAVGRVLAALERRGVAARTLVLFAGDNGTDARFLPASPGLPGAKGSLREGGVRTPLLVRWPGRVAAGASDDRVVAYTDYLATLVGAAGGAAHGFDFLADAGPRATPLFWEYGHGERRRWAALSADGRWRIVHGADGEEAVIDLAAGGADDPEGPGRLRRAYEGWRGDAATVAYRLVPRAPGGALITGNALARAPGFGGHTAVFCLDPAEAVTPQQLLDQAPLWSLRLEQEQLAVQVGELALRAPLPPQRPLTLVVDSRFDHALAFPGAAHAQLRVFAGGQLLAETATASPRLPLDVYHRPAYLGVDREGRRRFDGALAPPLLFNDDLAGLAAGDSLAQTARRLGAEACRGL